MRINLDDTDEQNRALEVIPRTHPGALPDKEFPKIRDTTDSACCKVKQGGVHLLKLLTLRASSKTENNKHRRVIRLEFNNRELPEGLEW